MISVTVLTKNVADTLGQSLESLIAFPEVVVLDNGSTDDTLVIASSFPNVKIYHHEFVGFGPLHNIAIGYATHDWILSIDADEVLSKELVAEILALKLNSKAVYEINRLNFFRGKAVKWCGWHPEYVKRLFHRKETSFSNDQVHEKVLQEGLIITRLKGAMHHYSYREVADFLEKMQTYSNLFADQYEGKRASSFTKALLKSWFTFFRSYILQRGFLGGAEGFLISKYNADVAFYKYLKLAYKGEQFLGKERAEWDIIKR